MMFPVLVFTMLLSGTYKNMHYVCAVALFPGPSHCQNVIARTKTEGEGLGDFFFMSVSSWVDKSGDGYLERTP